MNNSQRTKIIAQGIALYAEFQDTSVVHPSYNKLAQQWEDWSNEWPAFARFVCTEQYNLFDRVNAAF